MLYKFIERVYKQIPLKYQQRLKDLEFENLQKMRIEFTQGVVQKTFNYEIFSNKIQLIQTSTVIKEFFRILLKLETLPLYTMIYMLTLPNLMQSEIFILGFTITCLALDLMVSYLFMFSVLRQRFQFERRINQQQCRVLVEINQLLQEQSKSPSIKIQWQELKIGQIVCLQKGEQSPADILILESSQEQVIIDFKNKFPCPCTYINQASKTKGIMTKFLLNLSGWIQFQGSNHGTIKLKNDPKATQFTEENVILRGQHLTQTDWIFGIVIQVGHACFSQRDRFYNWNYYNQNSFFIFLIDVLIFLIFLIPRLIFEQNQKYSHYEGSIITCILLIPQNYFWISQIWQIYHQYQITKLERKQALIQPNEKQPQIQQDEIDPIIQEYDKKVLIQVQKAASTNNSVNNIPTQKKHPSFYQIYKFCQLTNQNIMELVKSDILVFENPQKLVKKNIRVCLIQHEKSKYYFNYERLQSLIEKASPRLKNNYEKLLIDTNRFQAYDEQKTLDIDLLLAEKQQPSLRIVEQKKPIQKAGFLKDQQNKLQFKEMKDSKDLKKQAGDLQKQNPYYSSFRKQSARNLFQTNNTLAQNQKESLMQSQQQLQQPQSNVTSIQNSPKIQRQKSHQHLSQSQMSVNNQKSQIGSLKNITPTLQDQSNDQIVGDLNNEGDFINKLLSQDDVVSNEILIIMLLCNDIESIYDKKGKKIDNIFKNRFDEQIQDFLKVFDYKFISSSKIDNFKVEYKQDQIIKKAVAIQGKVKVFEIIALLQPTENRKSTISVLVKDPESIELDEGALLYTKIETNERNEKDVRFQTINDDIEDMFWDGQNSIVYFKKQLNPIQTEQFLSKLNAINETYGNREEELEKLYQSIEQDSQLLFLIGLKQFIPLKNQLSSQELQNNNLNQDKLFQTLQKYNYKTCFIMDTYEELITFLRTYRVTDKNSVQLFLEKNTLTYKFRQFIQFMVEKQSIFEIYQQKIVDNFIIINDEALEAIVKDDYLKYHFVVLLYFSQGIGAYQLDEKQKGKFLKLIQITERYIASIGPGLDNQYFFYKSNYSFNVLSDDPQCILSNPNFLVSKVDQVFKLLFYYCPVQILNYEAIIMTQIYRSFLFGFLVYIIDYQKNCRILDEFFLFYLIPSNIVTLILNYDHFIQRELYDNTTFNIYRKRLELIKKKNIYVKILKVIFVALLDAMLVEISFNAYNTFHDQEFSGYSVFLYCILEIIEKQKYYVVRLNSFYETLHMIKLFFSQLLLVFILILAYSLSLYDVFYQFQEKNFIFWIFSLLLAMFISYIFQSVFLMTDFVLTNPYDLVFHNIYQVEIEKINQSLKYLNNSQQQNQPKKFIEKLFEGKDFMDESLQKKIKGDQQMADQMEKDLKFTDKRTEKDFLISLKSQKFYVYLLYELAIFGIRVYQSITNMQIAYLVISIIQFVVLSILSLFRMTKLQPLIMIGLRFIFFIILHAIWNTDLNETEMFFVAISIAHHPQLGIYGFFGICIISVIMDILMVGIFNNGNPYYILKNCLILIETVVPLAFQVYKTEFLQRYQYILQNKLLDEYKKLNDALGLLMPRFIKERMSKGQIQISEDQGDVAILFCDIYEFDDIIQNEQIKVVEFLDNVYRQFDQFCQANELQKIETVGKTYMAAGGLKEYNISSNQNPTERILDTALEMQESVKTMKYGDNKAVILKIGIHYGRVIAGVIGAHKPQFSLIGDTVNTTSRVCSTSEPGIITLSQQAYEKVNQKKYQFKLREVEAKGKGTIKTYQFVKTSKQQQQTVQKKADDISKSPIHTPNMMIKQIHYNLNTKKKTFMKKVSISEDKPDPITIQNTNVNANTKLIPSPTFQPMIRASSRSVFNSSFQIGNLTPNEQEIEKEKDKENNNQKEKEREKEKEKEKDRNFQQNLNQVQGDGLKSSIPLGGYGTSGQYQKKLSTLGFDLPTRRHRPSVYKRAGTKTNIPEQDPILGMAIGGAKMAESVKVEIPNMRKRKTRIIENKNFDFVDKIESLSVHKTPKELKNGQNADELEIRKLQDLDNSAFQNVYDIKNMEEKVENEKLGIQESDYKSENHYQYYSIYDQYKDYEHKQVKFFIVFIVAIMIFRNLLYFLLQERDQDLMITLISQSSLCLLLSFIIYHVRKIIILKFLIGFYFLFFSINSILAIRAHSGDMELVYQMCQITSVFFCIFYLQIYNQKDRIKLSILYVILILIILIYHDHILEIILFSINIYISCLIIQYKEFYILAENYQCYSQFESKNAKQTQILQYLLPQHVLGKFFSTDVNSSDDFTDVFENCTILFADIAGFTKYSSSVEPEQVVNMLRVLFQQFDEACQRFQVYKLYTIGDCYVCMGIIDANNRDPIGEAINVVLFGLKMIQIIQQINKDPQYQHLNMRIGAHTGRVIGGVVGTDVVRYDVYGEDVTIANKMESKGQEGKIMVSQATMELIESDVESQGIFEYEFSQDVYFPLSKQTVSTYFVHYDQNGDEQ